LALTPAREARATSRELAPATPAPLADAASITITRAIARFTARTLREPRAGLTALCCFLRRAGGSEEEELEMLHLQLAGGALELLHLVRAGLSSSVLVTVTALELVVMG
jgi:hypothetical protein